MNKKKIAVGVASALAILGGVVAMSAFEAHVINVTAKIENALSVTPKEIEFGTVFPQEYLTDTVTVTLSSSFREEGRVDDVDYVIRQKPKPRPDATVPTDYEGSSEEWCHENLPTTEYSDSDSEWTDYLVNCYYPLCEYLSKEPDGTPGNDGSLGAFHDMWAEVDGRLAKSEDDYEDVWTIDLDVPCFEGMCAQDWTHTGYELPADLESQMFGCDLWIEVGGISEVPQYESCTGWDCLGDADKDFFITGRYGDGIPTAGAWELAIWEYDGVETVVDQDDYGWISDQAVDFSLSYDPSDGSVEYTVGANDPLTWTYDSGMAFDYIVLMAKGNGDGNNSYLADLDVDGVSVPDFDSNNTYSGMVVPMTDAQQTDGFTVTGTAKLVWSSNPQNELPGFHVFAMGTHSNSELPQ